MLEHIHPPYIIIFIAIIILGLLYSFNMKEEHVVIPNSNVIRFMPIGDSYTIGNGVKEHERWPNLLIESLRDKGIEFELIGNPSVSGYDAEDALVREIPLFEKEKPDFGTLFIGTNDSFRDRSLDNFRSDYVQLLERMQNALTNKDNLIVITIPNYADFPGIKGAGVTDEAIEKYNQIIREEATKRNLKIVDLFQINLLVGMEYFIADGIHPNPKGIKVWHDAILLTLLEHFK